MRALISFALCGALVAGCAIAQRGGHGGGGGHFGGGGGGHFGGGGGTHFSGGGGFHGGSGGGIFSGNGGFVGGGHGGGVFSGGHSGGVFGGSGFRGGFGFNGFRGRFRGFYPSYGLGFGYSYWPSYGYYDYGYPYDYGYSYPAYNYDYSYPSYGYQQPSYQQPSNVTVIYPPAQSAAPQGGMYDGYGQAMRSPAPAAGAAPNDNTPPIYLIAMKDHTIQAAAAYWVADDTLHYVTLEHAEKRVALNDLDRDMTLRLNRERHVAIQLTPR